MTQAVLPAKHRPALRALERIASEPWAIREPALREIMAIAARAQADPHAVALAKAEPVKGTRTLGVRDGVGIVPVMGPIFRYANLFTEISGATSIEVMARDFAAAVNDPAIKGIVLDIHSPGGLMAGIGEMAGIIAGSRPVKPIVAYVGAEACSAAYYLASAASQIIMAPSAMVGSLGVVMSYIDTSKQDEMLGVEEIEIISSQSPYKRDTPSTDDGRARLQAVVDQLANIFIEDVAKYRGVGKAEVLSDFGQGGLLIGAAAVKVGMADRLGSFERTLRYVASGRAAAAIGRRGMAPAARRKSISIPSNAGGSPGGRAMSQQSNWERFKAWVSGDEPPPASDGYDDPDAAEAARAFASEAARATGPTAMTPARTVHATGQMARAESPEVKALREELAAERQAREADRAERERERQAVQAERDKAAAAEFVREEVRAGRAVPAQATELGKLFAQAARDDRERPVEGFSRVAALKASQAAVVPHGRTMPRVVGGEHEPDPAREAREREQGALETLWNGDAPGYDPAAEARRQNDRYLGGRRQAAT